MKYIKSVIFLSAGGGFTPLALLTGVPPQDPCVMFRQLTHKCNVPNNKHFCKAHPIVEESYNEPFIYKKTTKNPTRARSMILSLIILAKSYKIMNKFEISKKNFFVQRTCATRRKPYIEFFIVGKKVKLTLIPIFFMKPSHVINFDGS